MERLEDQFDDMQSRVDVADLEASIADLQKMVDDQQEQLDDYDAEIENLRVDIENVRRIDQALPAECVAKGPRVEQGPWWKSPPTLSPYEREIFWRGNRLKEIEY